MEWILNMVVKRDSSHIYEKKAWLSLKCECGRLNKTSHFVKKTSPRIFSIQTFTCSQATLRKNEKRKIIWLCSMRHWSTRKFENLFSYFPPIFKNTLVSKHDIGDLMKTYAEEEGIMYHPRKLLISSFTLQNDTMITPLLLFYLQLGFVCRKKSHLRWLHFKKMFQQLRTVNSRCQKTKVRESHSKCRCRYNEDAN